ncbi:SDA1-domain-containing protein [Lasiosphaeria miniovina]|uniref:Protein SDA1 n=1 Tax=Lasiosphaeria miniovina TaxID=1954250 RepID=A0AA39ZZ48_9PEZI|nr:SDA1-domain-containing protein [Lasiosphaeria miniovina]KAK0706318.1 SDA1-domain-containing protein [Lasiosphaeria miniovina]
MGKRKLAALEKVDADLVSLQYKIRRDPKSYAQEFYDQWLAYDAQRQIFISSPSTASTDDLKKFHDLVDLIAHVADLYPDLTGAYPDHLKELLNQHHAVLHPELREKVVGSLVLLRRKDVIDSTSLLTTLFPILISTPSKTLRSLLYAKIISDLRESNSKSTNHRLNRTIQTVLHNLVTSDRTSTKGMWATRITRELWRRQVWSDAKPCDVMKEACLGDNEKVVVGGVKFFLGGDKSREEFEDESSGDDVDLKRVKHQSGINKKSKKRQKAYEKAIDKVKKQDRKKSAPHPLNFSALHLLHDPQGFAEQLFQKHLQNTKNKFSLDNKLLILQLVTRLVGLHKLTIISLYSWFVRFLTPKQAQVTSFLASLAQATHDLVPPDAIEPLVVKIANEFVSEASASEVAAAGINSIREIAIRQPLCMTETLLQDLVLYQRSKDKGVVMAAKGLQSLYREVYPELLQKKYRGKEATMGLRSGETRQRKFGEEDVGGIEGIELLEQYKEEQKAKKLAEQEGLPEGDEGKKKLDDEDDDGFHSDEWEVGSTDSESSGGWIDVESDGEDDVPAKKRQKTGSEAPQLVDGDKENVVAEANGISTLAMTSILTPADLLKLQELRREARVDQALGNRSKRKKELIDRHIDEGVTAEDIELPATLGKKSTKEERVALAKDGKPGRDEHKSTQAIRKSKKEAEGKSSTNKEKARKKNFLMTVGKARAKTKRSLTDTTKALRQHVARSKNGGRRRNDAPP